MLLTDSRTARVLVTVLLFVLGLGFLYFVFRLARTKLPTTAPESRTLARHLLQASIIYLPVLFALMMLDKVSS